MFSKILTLLICVVNFTSASPLLPRDASAEPVALPASNGVISGNQVATLNVYSTSTNTNSIAGSKQCQTSAALSKLEKAVCYTIPTEGLGINIPSIVSGCKVYGYATPHCSDANQELTAGCFDVSNDTGSQLSSLVVLC